MTYGLKMRILERMIRLQNLQNICRPSIDRKNATEATLSARSASYRNFLKLQSVSMKRHIILCKFFFLLFLRVITLFVVNDRDVTTLVQSGLKFR